MSAPGSTTIAILTVGHSPRTWSNLSAPSLSVMKAIASATSARYWISLGVSSVVQGMGMDPSFIKPSTLSHHSGMRGSIASSLGSLAHLPITSVAKLKYSGDFQVKITSFGLIIGHMWSSGLGHTTTPLANRETKICSQYIAQINAASSEYSISYHIR
jgi:hypothetical protein